jgi:hypothetical protein
VHLDVPLSNIAVGWAQDQKAFIADRAFPRVPVDKQSGYYHKYKREFFFRDEAKKRAPGTESHGGGWEMDDPGTYFTDEWAYHKNTPWEVRENADAAIRVDEADTIFVTQKIWLRKEREFVESFFVSSAWTTTYSGVTATPAAGEFIFWDDFTNSDPPTDIANMQSDVKKITGFKPNALIVGEKVHFKLINHSKIIERYKYTQKGILSEDLIAAVLGVDYYLVAGAIYATTEEGETAAYDWVYGNDALLYYRNDQNPSPFTPSAGYIFYWRPYGQDVNIRRLVLQKERADRLEGFIFEDLIQPSADLGCFLSNCLSAAASS